MKNRGWAKGITDIKLVTDLGNTPASVNPKTGVVYINNKMKSRISADEWNFILLHELGHLVLQSSDEKEVDAWAFDQYAKKGGKLSKSVHALTNVLNFASPEHLKRANLQLRRAQLFDETYNSHHYEKEKNNQKKIDRRNQQNHREIEERLPMGERSQGSSCQSQKVRAMNRSNISVSPSGDLDFGGMESFLGIDFNNFGEKLTNTFDDIESISNSTVGAINAFRNPSSGNTYKGPGNVAPAPQSSISYFPPSNTEDNTMMYLGIGAGVLVLMFLAFGLMKK